MKPLRLLALLLAALLSLAACGGGDDEPAGSSTTSASGDQHHDGDTTSTAGDGEEEGAGGEEDHGHSAATFPVAEATQVVKISMRDYAYIDMPASVTGPRVRIEGKNNGPSAHEMVVFDADGNEVGGVAPFVSGESKALSIELTAGTYELRCRIAISPTETHTDRGMRVTFAVM